MKITIKLPKNKNFSIKTPNQPARRYGTAAGVLYSLKKTLPAYLELNKKTSITIKEYIDSSWTSVNETCDSSDIDYLIYCLTCFLEDYLSDESLRKQEQDWIKHLIL